LKSVDLATVQNSELGLDGWARIAADSPKPETPKPKGKAKAKAASTKKEPCEISKAEKNAKELVAEIARAGSMLKGFPET
jgi:hypothetical protein